MTDDKPKHKPQQKHTLSEVLKSLQDLIRTDLISAQPPPEPAEPPPQASPTTAEPDTFNSALDQLDRMITERIVEPVARAREEPPEPLLPDEALEIGWNDEAEGEPVADGATPPGSEPMFELLDDSIEFEPVPSETEPAPAQDAGVPDQEQDVTVTEIDMSEFVAADEARAHGEPTEEAPDEETIDVADDKQASALTDGPETFDFPAVPEEREPSLPDATPFDDVAFPTTEDAETIDLDADEPKQTGEVPPPAVEIPSQAVLDPPSEQPQGGATGPEPAEPLQAPDRPPSTDTQNAPPTRADATPGTDDATTPLEETAVKPTPKESAPEERPKPNAAASPANSGRSDIDDQIPVLKDVADVEAPPSPPLPDAAQARDIAIRVIAKLNIERRKAGEPQMDIKTIDRLQQYLADALTKRALNKPK